MNASSANIHDNGQPQLAETLQNGVHEEKSSATCSELILNNPTDNDFEVLGSVDKCDSVSFDDSKCFRANPFCFNKNTNGRTNVEDDNSDANEQSSIGYSNSVDLSKCSALKTAGFHRFNELKNLEGDDRKEALKGDALEFALSRIEILEEELRSSRLELLVKEQKCNSLIKLQTKVDNEVEELTGALFQEAYRMVNTAEERSQNAERLLAEARLKVDVLEGEVLGLKQIVKDTSRSSTRRSTTPQSANSASAILRFLNNSLSAKSVDLTPTSNGVSFSSAKRSIFSSTPLTMDVPLRSASAQRPSTNNSDVLASRRSLSLSNGNEMDPVYYREFTTWRENALGIDENCAFLKRTLCEDVEPCLVFENKELSQRILAAVKDNTLEMEPYASSNDSESTVSYNFTTCTLLGVRRPCPYRLRISSESEWHFISLLARNRIAAVCDFFTYIRYLHQGIIKPSANDSYWTIVNLRKNMALAKLGLHFVLKMNGGNHFGSASSPDSSAATSPLQTQKINLASVNVSFHEG